MIRRRKAQNHEQLPGTIQEPADSIFAHSQTGDAEIAPHEWIPFLDRFSRQHQGWLATITVGRIYDERTEAGDWHLQGVSSDHIGSRGEIYVSVSRSDGGYLTHAVKSPTKVIFLRDFKGAHLGLDITSADGTRTKVRFRSAVQPERPNGDMPDAQRADSTPRPSAERSLVAKSQRLQTWQTDVHIPIDRVMLEGNLSLPQNARGIVVFAHGSGSGRRSPRNRYVVGVVQKAGFGTLLMDLLTAEEEALDEHTTALRFDIDLLARRLIGATRWLVDQSQTPSLPVGYFGASTGAAAALVAAVEVSDLVSAVVSRGGRPDLVGGVLHKVIVPTLLIVGGRDNQVIELNREAEKLIPGPTKMEIVAGATHLFEEPGALESVASLATDWFSTYLARASEGSRAA